LKATEDLAKEALRTLGIAYRALPKEARANGPVPDGVESELVFAGLVGMMDPPREEAKRAVSRAQRAGIRAVMITGDHPITATVIGRELGIQTTGAAVTGSELTQMSDPELRTAVQRSSVYARVSPEHKLRIVHALQKNGAIVGMTGDGVNDAPALKTADIGIAMGITGTDVSKEVADMVLADDNFATIVAAIEEGRSIFANIRKFLVFLLSSNIGEVMTMFFGVLLANFLGLKAGENGLVLPLLATQILWINFVTDGAPALALGVDPADPTVMENPPRPGSEKVITGRMWAGILFVGAVMAAATLSMLDAGLPGGLIDRPGNMRYAQTLAFTTLVLLQLFNIFNCRSDEQSAFVKPFSNRRLLVAIGASLLLQAVAVYVPVMQKAFSTTALTWNDWLLCAGVASSVLWLRELSKLILRRTKTRKAI
jgi:Ca2+-transporting ATPase